MLRQLQDHNEAADDDPFPSAVGSFASDMNCDSDGGGGSGGGSFAFVPRSRQPAVEVVRVFMKRPGTSPLEAQQNEQRSDEVVVEPAAKRPRYNKMFAALGHLGSAFVSPFKSAYISELDMVGQAPAVDLASATEPEQQPAPPPPHPATSASAAFMSTAAGSGSHTPTSKRPLSAAGYAMSPEERPAAGATRFVATSMWLRKPEVWEIICKVKLEERIWVEDAKAALERKYGLIEWPTKRSFRAWIEGYEKTLGHSTNKKARRQLDIAVEWQPSGGSSSSSSSSPSPSSSSSSSNSSSSSSNSSSSSSSSSNYGGGGQRMVAMAFSGAAVACAMTMTSPLVAVGFGIAAVAAASSGENKQDAMIRELSEACTENVLLDAFNRDDDYRPRSQKMTAQMRAKSELEKTRRMADANRKATFGYRPAEKLLEKVATKLVKVVPVIQFG
jgi:hypothetical protein